VKGNSGEDQEEGAKEIGGGGHRRNKAKLDFCGDGSSKKKLDLNLVMKTNIGSDLFVKPQDLN